MCEAPGTDGENYPLERIEALFYQVDTLFHQRVNCLLLAETIFFAAAVTVWDNLAVVLIFSGMGALSTVLFTFTSLKLYWRLILLINMLKNRSDFHRNYFDMVGLMELGWGYGTAMLMRFLIPAPKLVSPEGQERNAKKKTQPRMLDTGWLYTWGLFVLAMGGWIAIVWIRLLHSGDAAPPGTK